jgi:hypothetical protein
MPCVMIKLLQRDIDGALRDHRVLSRPATFCDVVINDRERFEAYTSGSRTPQH